MRPINLDEYGSCRYDYIEEKLWLCNRSLNEDEPMASPISSCESYGEESNNREIDVATTDIQNITAVSIIIIYVSKALFFYYY